MDDCSGFLINRFLREKSDLARQGSMLIQKLNDQYGIKIRVIGCVNAGENKKIEEACDRLGLGTKFEYTVVGIAMYIRDTALRLKQQGLAATKSALSNMTVTRTAYQGGYFSKGTDNPYHIDTKDGKEDISWLL